MFFSFFVSIFFTNGPFRCDLANYFTQPPPLTCKHDGVVYFFALGTATTSQPLPPPSCPSHSDDDEWSPTPHTKTTGNAFSSFFLVYFLY